MVFSKAIPPDEEAVESALAYIDSRWKRLKRVAKRDSGSLIGLPNPYIVPSEKTGQFSFEEQYYWDSYFTALGMTSPKQRRLVEGMLDNLIYLYDRFGLVPTASRMYFLSRSQPPLLTSFIFLVYDRYGKSDKWLKKRIEVAEREYRSVWVSTEHPYWHNVHRGLSRYYDIHVLHDLAEAESGWDMTTRFDRRCLDYLPIDLNALLFKYEMDFVRAAEIFGEHDKADEWRSLASARAATISELMWGKARGFFFDYNFQRKKLGDVWSVAGYYMLWAGAATPHQAERMVHALGRFEKRGGLATTARPLVDTSIFGSLKTQWAYPNGWAPLHYIVIEGLERYGYHKEARRIAERWLRTCTDFYSAHGVFLEKYNVVNPRKRPNEGVYPAQEGFGWTNGVYAHLAKRYGFANE